ncbi:hypothetical protein EUTSA_v10006193mg [Eutrema salsugineum]|uniref:Uncharacterized protein n=1 Tax=Eutrema salsugineum TaxID=72664 RepID=V4LJE2_EUTSA|nr:uncharacterized protein LOC18019844 [Eutrema salsugineum]ESQ43869.1 hypothetical protein EUTSA_v10006193mg [Eutrema salsugineum]
MAFDESLMMISSFTVLEEDAGFHQIRNSLSRLSVCTSSVYDEATKNEPDLGVFTSEAFDGAEADGEFSDGGGRGKENVRESDSDKDTPRFYSLPVTPSRRRRKLQISGELVANESNRDGIKCNLRRQRRVIREKKKKGINDYGNHGFNGESDGGGREALTVLTTAKGGEKSLRMGLEEVKACRDLGFELEAPGRISVSTGSNFDTQTSSGGNSPIASWRISSPGDDPKEVKARLKVWAQAVALASSSRQA